MPSRRLCFGIVFLMLFSTTISGMIVIEDSPNKELKPQSLGETEEGWDTSSRSTACTGSICLSEVMVNAAGAETDAPGADHKQGEWIEIYNQGSSTVDLSSYSLEDHYSRSMTITTSRVHLPAGATDVMLAAGGYIVVARNGDGGSCGLCLKNTGGLVTLKDSSGTAVDEASWPSSGAEGTTLIEDPSDPTADWIGSNSMTAGAANSGATTPPSVVDTGIKIREVLANPYWSADNSSWPGGEWFEIENIGNDTVELAGGDAMDGNGYNISLNASHLIDFANSTTIEAGARRVISIGDFRAFGVLNNAGDNIILHIANGSITDDVTYPAVKDGRSEVVDSTGLLWTTALWPTPGGEDALSINGTSDLSMNEVQVNASTTGAPYPDGEWIELYLDDEASGSLGLGGWTIRTATGGLIDASGVADCTCPIGAPAILAAGDFGVVQINGSGAQMLYSGDMLSLVDPSGAIVQTVDWSSYIPNNQTLIPITQGASTSWALSSYNTPAERNPGQGGGSTNDDYDVRITEFMPNPFGNDTVEAPGGEWIEITNIGNDSVNLTGWRLRTSGNLVLSETTVAGDLILDAGERMVVYVNMTSSFWLTNSMGGLVLQNEMAIDVHSIVYTSVMSGTAMVADPLDDNGSWVFSPWPTPGSPNPSFDTPYTGPTTLSISEVMPQCSGDASIPLAGEWVEINNSALLSVNLSRWTINDEDGKGIFIQPGAIWNRSTSDMTLDGHKYAVIIMNESFLDNSGDSLTLVDPDGNVHDTVAWSSSDDCQSLEPSDGGLDETLGASPGVENYRPAEWNGDTNVRFSRLMVKEVSGRGHDWLELTNIGDTTVQLEGWTISRNRTGKEPWLSVFRDYSMTAGDNLIITAEPTNLWADARIVALDGDVVLNNMPYLPDTGGALQLISPDDIVVDTVVYGTGDATITGWSGPAIANPPMAEAEGLIHIRGNGCDAMPDSDSAGDWEIRWLRMGSSLFCDETTFNTTGTLTPSIGPEQTLGQLLGWLDATQTSLHVHVYELDSPELTQKLVDLAQSGVEVTLLLEGWIYAPADSQKKQRGYAATVADAGGTVLWMVDPPAGTSPSAPYAFIHSKVAVRDESSVWISSGNWKRTSQPLDGDNGNREWSLFIDSPVVAAQVLTRMAWDEDPGQLHIAEWDEDDTYLGRPSSWDQQNPEVSRATAPAAPTTFQGAFSGRLLTCPDDCIDGLVDLIHQADSTIDISVQYFDPDWTWGFGGNPLLAAIETAMVERNVSVRILQNAAYADEDDDIREMVHYVNENWNRTMGLDATAILMSTEEGILKLHNKGMIIDGETVLVSSINWGSNSALRNREMGIAIEHAGLAAYYLASFEEDWNRLDNVTDSDGDMLPDYWEIAYGLNRTTSLVPGSELSEQSLDPDGDGLNNLKEFEQGGDPLNPDTDGDCIGDGAEQTFADLKGISIQLAITSADADGDGTPDGESWGCATGVPDDTNNGGNGDGDSGNGDGNGDAQVFREDALASGAAKMLLGIVVLAAITLLAAVAVMMLSKGGVVDESLVDDVGYIFDAGPGLTGTGELAYPTLQPEGAGQTDATADSALSRKGGGAVILEGTSVAADATGEARERTSGRNDGRFGAPTLDGRPASAQNVPGLDPETVQAHLDAGWTIEQMHEHYGNQ